MSILQGFILLRSKETERQNLLKLRKITEYIPKLSLGAKCENKIVGHILLYPIKIINSKRKCNTLALAPISVIPKFQLNGVGSRLIREGLEMAQELV